MAIGVFFIIAKNWKQPKNPSTDELLNKLPSVHPTILLSNEEKQTVTKCYNTHEL